MSDIKEGIIGATPDLGPTPAMTEKPDPSSSVSPRASSPSCSPAPEPGSSSPPLQQRWNNPRINIFRIAVAYFSFIVSGFTDAAYGPLIPSLEKYYNLSYTPVSVVFLTPLAGYIVACSLNHYLARALGRRGPATIGPISRMVMFIVVACRPPFAAVAAISSLAGFTCGYQDGAWNSWLGGGLLENPSVLLGGLHACYGVGALLSPLVSTLMLERGWGWWYYFYFMIALEAVELAVSTPAFWAEDGKAYREEQRLREQEGGGQAVGGGENENEGEKGNPLKEAVLTMPTARTCWTAGIFLLFYTGIEVGYGGWTTTFMLVVRGASTFNAGMATTGYWLGITLGRVTLGFVNAKIGERLALFIYIPLTIALEIVYFTVPNAVASAVAVSLAGYFLGPVYPAGIVVLTRLLPKRLQMMGISFVATVSKTGACVVPFIVGAVAESKGISVLHPVMIGILGAMMVLWSFMPREKKEKSRTGVEGEGEGEGEGKGRGCFGIGWRLC